MLRPANRILTTSKHAPPISMQTTPNTLTNTDAESGSAKTLRRRQDLEIRETSYQGEPSWIVKDPVSLKYYRLMEPEYVAFCMIDGRNRPLDIQLQLDRQFPELSPKVEDVQSLIHSLYSSGMLISSGPRQEQSLTKRRNRDLQQKAIGLTMSLMSLKFPGVDPERFLTWLYPKVRWLFSIPATVVFAVLIGSALTLVLVNLQEFYRRLPEFSQFFDVQNLLLMGLVLIVTKSVHELGHGLMCKHFGGECHEIGFMFLVMTPAMYCNTSDSWTLPNRWHRIAIGAAGMYVEVIIASIATFVWWNTTPGTLHYLSLNAMFLCGISTILFNANPLLRYDGYYMLSDYLEIPNLSQKANRSLVNVARSTMLGMKIPVSRLTPARHRFTFAAYAVASFVYRWFVMLMIFWFITQLFEPYGLAMIGHLLISISLIGMIVIPVFKAGKYFLFPGRFRDVKPVRAIISLAVISALLGIVLFLPLRQHVTVDFVTRPHRPQNIYATSGGQLVRSARQVGDRVSVGDEILELENLDLKIALEKLEGQYRQHEAELAVLRSKVGASPEAAGLIAGAMSRLADVQARLEIQNRKNQSLTKVASRDGFVLPPPPVPAVSNDPVHRTLTSWNGTPLDRDNEGVFVEAGTLMCLIADPEDNRAVLGIEQSQRSLVSPGDVVRLMFDAFPGQEVEGTIDYLAEKPIEDLAPELSLTNGGGIATRVDRQGREVPLLTYYEATVRLPPVSGQTVLNGFRGRAKIRIDDATLASRLVRYLQSVVHFR